MENKPNELKNTSYELFIGALSVLSIVNLALLYLLRDTNVSAVVLIMDGILSLVFISDFLYRFFTAESKSVYFFRQTGWADLLASLPVPQLKILRLFRIVRVYRLGKEYGGSRMVKEFFANRSGSALLSLVFVMLLILEFGALAMLAVESRSPDANITDAVDAVWYVYVTITTVGYGDQYPVTNVGRIIGVLIMTVGVGLFGTITAFLANAFIGPEDSAPAESAVPAVAPADLLARLDEISNMLRAHEKTSADLKAKIENLEVILERQDN